MPKRKTHTSSEVKNRWNAKHYDISRIVLPKGGAEELKAIAAAHGTSVSAYIRTLIIRDNAENPESTHFIGGGGGVLESYPQLMMRLKDLLNL